MQCPSCGNSQEATFWQTINVTVSPELKQFLMNGTINTFACEKCGEKAFINTPLMYHDMDQKFCVQYYPPEALDDAQFFRQFNPDGSLAMDKNSAALASHHLARPHIVFSMVEMLNYIVFRDGLVANKETKEPVGSDNPESESE
jgi:hypothetical protein